MRRDDLWLLLMCCALIALIVLSACRVSAQPYWQQAPATQQEVPSPDVRWRAITVVCTWRRDDRRDEHCFTSVNTATHQTQMACLEGERYALTLFGLDMQSRGIRFRYSSECLSV